MKGRAVGYNSGVLYEMRRVNYCGWGPADACRTSTAPAWGSDSIGAARGEADANRGIAGLRAAAAISTGSDSARHEPIRPVDVRKWRERLLDADAVTRRRRAQQRSVAEPSGIQEVIVARGARQCATFGKHHPHGFRTAQNDFNRHGRQNGGSALAKRVGIGRDVQAENQHRDPQHPHPSNVSRDAAPGNGKKPSEKALSGAPKLDTMFS